MNILRDIRERAAARPTHIVLSEGHDPRVVAAAITATTDALARITLVGPRAEISAQLAQAGGADLDIAIEDPETSELTSEFTDAYIDLRRHRRVSREMASVQAHDRMIFSALMVRNGHADGTVGGAVATTTQTVRAALQIIGKAESAPLVSSFFLMVLPEGHPSGREVMVFADCGLVIEPDAAELAAIAAQSAASCIQMLEIEPKIAFLSFSTKGSAHHVGVTKVTKARDIFCRDNPTISADGELQFDAAFMPEIGASKAPDSDVAGHANVMVFPNLDAGNIGYKIAQRIGGCQAIGPVLQGLAKPANDLSRGCVAQDVVNMIAVTALQAAHQKDPT